MLADLRATRDAGGSMKEQWRDFVESAQKTKETPPYHLRGIFGALREVQGDRPAGEVVILDHGCSGAQTLLYLLALGYTRIYGVDIGGNDERWHRLLEEESGICEPRFFHYDGHTLPLKDGSVDFIFSQQVLEHVDPSLVDAYYAEEGRVLKAGGAVFHQVPHRLVPYESHTRTWFIHYFPKPIRNYLYRSIGCDPDYVEGMLYLRTRSYHWAQVEKYIGVSRDVTVERLGCPDVLEHYEGPKTLRRVMIALVRAPFIGHLTGEALKHLVMMETISMKTAQSGTDTVRHGS